MCEEVTLAEGANSDWVSMREEIMESRSFIVRTLESETNAKGPRKIAER